jgi:zinc D-Ala-D-Ala carboxypeptidase
MCRRVPHTLSGMSGTEGTASGRGRRRQAILLAGFGLVVGACQSPPPTPPVPTYARTPVVRSEGALVVGQAPTGVVAGQSRADGSLAVGAAAVDTVGGLIADNALLSPFDVDDPAISLLDPLLRKAIQDAARHARADGIDLQITSGWRSKGFQQRLFDDAVRRYGSDALAAQYVASPSVSKHVRGEAVDVGPVAGDTWLIRNGAQFGLCQIYANEIWHFELVADGQGHCPPLLANAAG